MMYKEIKEIVNYIAYTYLYIYIINLKGKKKNRLLDCPHLETQFRFDELLRITNSPGETGGIGGCWPQFLEPGGSWTK